jgi:hypothetical protein
LDPQSHRNGDRIPHVRQAVPSWRRSSPRKRDPPPSSHKHHKEPPSGHRRNRSRSRERERERDGPRHGSGSWRSPVKGTEGRLYYTPPHRKKRRERSRSTSPVGRYHARRRSPSSRRSPRDIVNRSHDRGGARRSSPKYDRGHK